MSFRSGFIFALCLFLAACSSHDNTPGFVVATKSQTVSAAGGTVNLTDAAGNTYALSIPAGALPGGTVFKITTLPPGPGQLFRIKLEPEGLLFMAGKDATLTITLPAGVTLPATGGFRYNGANLPFTRNGDGSLTVSLSALMGTLGSSAKLETARMLAKAGDFLIGPAEAATITQCGSQPLPGSAEEGLSAELNTELNDYTDCMLGAIQSLQANGHFADALRASLAISALKQAYANDTTALAAMASAQQSACSIYREVLDQLNGAAVDEFGAFTEPLQRVMYWKKITQQLGDCEFEFDPQAIVTSKAEEAKSFYQIKETDLAESSSSDDYNDGLQEAGALSVVHNEAEVLEVTSFIQPVDNTARPQVESALIAAPWKDCHDSGDYTALIALRNALPANTAVQTAAQYCGTRLNATVKDGEGATQATLAPSLGGVSASSKRVAGSVPVKKGQQLVLLGPIKVLGCPSGSSASETLEVKFNGVALTPLSGGDYLANPLTYQVNSLLAAASLENTPEAELGSYELTLTRSGNTCGGFWGENPQPLMTVTLDFGNAVCKPVNPATYCITPILDSSSVPVAGIPAGINEKGSVLLVNGAAGGALWRAGVVTPLQPFNDAVYTYAVALNNQDQVVGYAYGGNSTCFVTPLVWQNGVVSQLPGASGGAAFGINDSGQIVGWSKECTRTNADYPALWNSAATPSVSLDTGAFDGVAYGINDAGVAVGTVTFNQGTSTFTGAARWTPGTGREVLFMNTGGGDGGDSRTLLAIDNFGTILFYHAHNNSGIVAETLEVLGATAPTGSFQLGPSGHLLAQGTLIDSQAGTTQALNNSLVDPALGWDLTHAQFTDSRPAALSQGSPRVGFDRLGRIAGRASRNGVDTGFILTPAGVKLPPVK